MLVLSRKTGERIHIGDNITIEVRRVAGNRVTLALDAPRDVRILRGELQQAAREFQSPPEPASAEETDDRAADTRTYVIMHRRMPAPDQMTPEHWTSAPG